MQIYVTMANSWGWEEGEGVTRDVGPAFTSREAAEAYVAAHALAAEMGSWWDIEECELRD